MQKIKIHFVCRGNIYRSRLAQAYLGSMKGAEWDVSSSGIGADQQAHILTSPWAIATARQHGILASLGSVKTQTTSQLLQASSIIVFMGEDVYKEAKQRYEFNDALSVVWRVKDRQDWPKKMPDRQKRQGTFQQIMRHVNQLIDQLSRASWVDIVDEHNEPLGYTLPLVLANQKALWHRGCHALITTPAFNTLVEKRSQRIFLAPGLIDVTLGGAVDAGEAPQQAILREIKEEIGLEIDPRVPRLIEVHKWNSYHPRYKRRTKVFLYTYHVPIAEENPMVVLQKEEVQAVKSLSRPELKRLIRLHRLRRLGRLNYSYVYYSRIIKQVGLL